MEEELISNLSLIKNARLRQQQVEDGKTIQTQIKNLWKLYQGYSALKKEHKRMDFDDMLGYALTVLKRYPPILRSTASATATCASTRRRTPPGCNMR